MEPANDVVGKDSDESKPNALDRETAREHFCILYDALYAFKNCSCGGNLHILTDDCNVSDNDITWLETHLNSVTNETPRAQMAVERAILDLFKEFSEHDRLFILYGVDIIK
jgi:hypothetical protein